MDNLILSISLITIGISLVAMELAVPGLYLAALGAGAIASGLIGYFFGPGPLMLFILLAMVSVGAYLVLLSSRKYEGFGKLPMGPSKLIKKSK